MGHGSVWCAEGSDDEQSVVFIWGGGFWNTESGNYYTLEFEMGARKEREERGRG